MTTADEALLLLLREARGWLHDVTADFVDRKAAKRDAEELGARIDRALQSAPRAVPPGHEIPRLAALRYAGGTDVIHYDEVQAISRAYLQLFDAAPEAPLPGQSAEAEPGLDRQARQIADQVMRYNKTPIDQWNFLMEGMCWALPVLAKALLATQPPGSPPSPAGQRGEAMRERDIEAANRQAMFFDWCALLGFGIQGWPEEAANQLRAHFREMWNRALRASAQPTPPKDEWSSCASIGQPGFHVCRDSDTVEHSIIVSGLTVEQAHQIVDAHNTAPAAMAEAKGEVIGSYAGIALRGLNLCSDCPPADYPTDKTRCGPCPRRASGAQGDAGE